MLKWRSNVAISYNVKATLHWCCVLNLIHPEKNKEVFVKHEKAPTAPRFEGVMTISFMPMFWKITAFGYFWPTSGSRKCQKAHIHTKTIHLNLFSGLYDRPLEIYSLESYVSKNRCFNNKLCPYSVFFR